MLKFVGDRAVGLGASDKELVHSFRKMAVKMMVSYLAAQQRAGVRRKFAASFCEPRGILASSPGLRRRRRSPQTPMTRSSLRAGDSASRPKTVVSPQPPSLTPGGVALSPISVRPGLLAGLALGIPALPGALCVGSADLFDPRDKAAEDAEDVAYRHEAALQLCASCPARARCEEWLAGLDPGDPYRPTGIVAGQLIRRPRWRPKVAV
jgi:WhiB family redox-sensing transcriptional regulator